MILSRRLTAGSILLLFLSAALAAAVPPPLIRAAEPARATVQGDQDEEASGESEGAAARGREGETPPLPQLPETQVIGRPAPFPSQPLNESTVVSPSLTETAAGETGSSLTVITEQQILDTRKSTVLENLRDTVGLDVVQSGGPGRAASIFIRGANSEQTKVFLDGIPLNDPGSATRAFDFSTLMTDNIERIEVLRGPQSMVYGSDAMGGVINIITKRGDGPLQARARLMGGSFGTRQEAVSASGGDRCKYYSVSASYFETDGISAASPRFGATEKDFYRNATFSGRFGWTPSDLLNVDYVFRYIDADSAIDDFDFLGQPIDNLIRQNRRRQFFNRIQIQSFLLDGLIEQKVGFSVADSNLRDTDPGFFSPSRFDGQTRKIDWLANLRLLENNTLMAGVNYLQEEASNSDLSLQSQHLAAFFLEDRFRLLDRSFTTIGVRWDDHSTAGTASTYRLTQLFRIDETGSSLHGSIGTGFRAPAIAQRFGFFGNPNLRPEFSKGWDVGASQELLGGALLVDTTYFRNDFTNLIVFDTSIPGPGGFGALNNVGKARTSGVELTATVYVTPATTLRASYTYLDTLNLDTDAELLRRARNKASLGVHQRCWNDRGSINLYFLYVGPRLDFGVGDITQLGDYILLNASGAFQLSDRLELFARMDNLLDQNYEEVFGLSTPGVSGYAGVNATW